MFISYSLLSHTVKDRHISTEKYVRVRALSLTHTHIHTHTRAARAHARTHNFISVHIVAWTLFCTLLFQTRTILYLALVRIFHT